MSARALQKHWRGRSIPLGFRSEPLSRNKCTGGYDIGVHATKIVLFVDCIRPCRQRKAKKVLDYLSFTNAFLGEPESDGLVVEPFLKNLRKDKYEKNGWRDADIQRRSRFCESNCGGQD